MKTKKKYLAELHLLNFNDLNECLLFLGYERQTNKSKALAKLKGVEENLSEEDYSCLIDYALAKRMDHYEYALEEILPLCSREVLEKLTRKLYLDGYINEDDLEMSDELSQVEILRNFSKLIEEHDDEFLIELLIEINEDNNGLLIDDSEIPDEELKKYLLSKLGIKAKQERGDKILLSTNYNPDLLNMAGVKPYELIDKLKKVQEYLKKDGAKEFYNYSIIFEGASGVGKTEFAKYLASILGQHFSYVSFGGLSSGFHGETESNIRNFFEEAQKKDSLVFIDEADSFLFNRQQGKQSFEISVVNEMLQQIEKYPGMVICSTNLLGKIDHAALRRFAEKITFEYLSIDQAIKAFEIFFKHKLNSSDVRLLENFQNLSLGDFKVVRQKTFFEEKIQNLELISLLEKEVNFRQRIESVESLGKE